MFDTQMVFLKEFFEKNQQITTKQERAKGESAVSNVSGNRCESDCRSRCCRFDPGTVPYFPGVEHEIISTVILLPSTESFKKGCCQLQAKVCAQSTG